jgi:hypothetical protein
MFRVVTTEISLNQRNFLPKDGKLSHGRTSVPSRDAQDLVSITSRQ